MEFPSLGQHCGSSECHRLDFLPVKCDACGDVFCHDHFAYTTHHCPSAYKKDVQVPVCPLCSSPVPIRKGESPDAAVGAHIDAHCRSHPKRKVYTNACAQPKCKKKELVPVSCATCERNFCLQHRHETDHDCRGPPQTPAAASRSGFAALSRLGFGGGGGGSGGGRPAAPRPPADMRNKLQAGLSEDEALARALQASMGGAGPSGAVAANSAAQSTPTSAANQEEADRQLAEALARSEREATSTGAPPRQDKGCVVH